MTMLTTTNIMTTTIINTFDYCLTGQFFPDSLQVRASHETLVITKEQNNIKFKYGTQLYTENVNLQ